MGFCYNGPDVTFLPRNKKMKSVTTILFVENDAVALTMYQKRLQREGFHVETAEDGIAALKVLSEMTPDIVVLDLMLPKFSGRDVFDYMRADAQFKNVPVIIFSNASKSRLAEGRGIQPDARLAEKRSEFCRAARTGPGNDCRRRRRRRQSCHSPGQNACADEDTGAPEDSD